MSEQAKTALTDPLLAAVISKLPTPGNGTTWSKADRINWLRMFVMAANVSYGDAAGISVTDVEERPPLRFAPVLVDHATGESRPAPGPLPTRAEAGQARYVIDADGFALRDMMPIDPEDIPPGTPIYDERTGPEHGDLSSVYWKTGGVRTQEQLPSHVKLQEAA